ncbi:MAG: helix-turn-helix transcriptional regulator [Elusimicrobiota bacterium]
MGTNLQTEVGKQIRQLRLGHGLTIEELAFRAHLHPSYLGDIERGTRNPSLLNLKKIAEGLGKPISTLFSSTKCTAPSTIREKPAKYLSTEMDKALLSLIRSLRKNSGKDQAYIIRSAKALSAKLKGSR